MVPGSFAMALASVAGLAVASLAVVLPLGRLAIGWRVEFGPWAYNNWLPWGHWPGAVTALADGCLMSPRKPETSTRSGRAEAVGSIGEHRTVCCYHDELP